MENSIKGLRDYVTEHKIIFVENCDEPCLNALWCHYGETHCMSSATNKGGFWWVCDSLSRTPPKATDEIV